MLFGEILTFLTLILKNYYSIVWAVPTSAFLAPPEIPWPAARTQKNPRPPFPKYSHVVIYLSGLENAPPLPSPPTAPTHSKQIRTNHGHDATNQTQKVPPPHVTTAQLRFLPKPETRSPGVSASKHRAPRCLWTFPKLVHIQKTRGHSKTGNILVLHNPNKYSTTITSEY